MVLYYYVSRDQRVESICYLGSKYCYTVMVLYYVSSRDQIVESICYLGGDALYCYGVVHCRNQRVESIYSPGCKYWYTFLMLYFVIFGYVDMLLTQRTECFVILYYYDIIPTGNIPVIEVRKYNVAVILCVAIL